jgi:hypothetical protein
MRGKMQRNDLFDVESTVRPVRLAFLVEPNNKTDLKSIFQINSEIWGGKYNPIFPLYKTKPKPWKTIKDGSCEDIIQALIQYAEPDFLVEITPGSAARYSDYIPVISIRSIRPTLQSL